MPPPILPTLPSLAWMHPAVPGRVSSTPLPHDDAVPLTSLPLATATISQLQAENAQVAQNLTDMARSRTALLILLLRMKPTLLAARDYISEIQADKRAAWGDRLQESQAVIAEDLAAIDHAIAGIPVLSGMGACAMASVNMDQVLESGYDTPEQVPEWAWVETHASFSHRGNRQEQGVFDFIINLALTFEDVPTRLQPVLENARAGGYAYLLFHQGC